VSSKVQYNFGKVCPRHPDLGGERYVTGGCTACVKARRRRHEAVNKKASQAQVKAALLKPERDAITAAVDAEVRAARQQTWVEIKREERRRALLREEGGQPWRR